MNIHNEKADTVCLNRFVLSGSQVLLLPRGPDLGHSSADPRAGQTSAGYCAAAGSFTVTTDAAAATPAA